MSHAKLGVKTTFIDDDTFKLTFYPDFLLTLIHNILATGKFELTLHKLDQPSDKGFSHKIIIKEIKDR